MRKISFSKTADNRVNIFADGKLVKGTELNLSHVAAAKKAYQWSPAVEQMYLHLVKQRLSDCGFHLEEITTVLTQYKKELESV